MELGWQYLPYVFKEEGMCCHSVGATECLRVEDLDALLNDRPGITAGGKSWISELETLAAVGQ